MSFDCPILYLFKCLLLSLITTGDVVDVFYGFGTDDTPIYGTQFQTSVAPSLDFVLLPNNEYTRKIH